MKRILLAILIANVVLALAQSPAPQTWTSSDGRVIQAKFIKLDGETVIIEKDGTSFAVPFEKLKPESVELAKKLGGGTSQNDYQIWKTSFGTEIEARYDKANGNTVEMIQRDGTVRRSTLDYFDAEGAAKLSQLSGLPLPVRNPTTWFGKTFEQCELVLGKPQKTEEPNGEWRSYARYYKSANPALSRIKLERVPDGSMSGPVPETVNTVWIYFPKGKIETLGQALTTAGLSTDGLEDAVLNTKLQLSGSDLFKGIKGGIRAIWATAENTKTRPPQYQHPDEDSLFLTVEKPRQAKPPVPLTPFTSVPPAAPHSPTAFLGKTYEECEKVLGAPLKSTTPTDGGRPVFSREYKSPTPGISRIELVRMPEGGMSNPPPETVNSVTYYFPKGSLTTMGAVFNKLALDRAGVSNRTSYKSKEASEAARKGVRSFSPWDEPLPVDALQISRSAHKIAGGLAAYFTPAAASLATSAPYQHPDEDALQVKRDSEDQLSRAQALPPLVTHDSPELRQNGAFGFPQAAAKILRDSKEARFSAWSNADWLYVQVVVWADDDDALGTMAGSDKPSCDQTLLLIDADADQQDTAQVDRKYTLDPFPNMRGIHMQTSLGEGKNTLLSRDSKGRGCIRFLPANDGKKIRVDSFLIPLSELGRKPGEKVRLIVSGTSKKPDFAYNSAGLVTNGRAMFYTSMPKQTYHDFTLGEQTGKIEAIALPDDRQDKQ